MNTVYLSLGSNLGNRIKNLRNAVLMLQFLGKDFHYSSVYQTSPWGFNSTEEFLNMALSFKTEMNAEELLSELLSVEKQLGRFRNNIDDRYQSRIIDVDILLFGDQIINTDKLQIPHRFLHERKFVLVPLNEIAAELIHPINKKTITELLIECNDVCNVIFNSKFASI